MAENEELTHIRQELQMVTGVVSNDVDYLVYLLLKDGDYFKESAESKYVKPDAKDVEVQGVQELADWFSNL